MGVDFQNPTAVFGVQVPDTPDCPRHVLLRRLGGGAQFCDRGAKIGGKLLLWDLRGANFTH